MSDAADIEARAAAWIARCDARGDDQDPELAAWLSADPRHRAAYLRLARAWERTRCLARLRPAAAIDPDLLAPPAPRPVDDVADGVTIRSLRSTRPRTTRLIAAVTGIAASLIIVMWHLMPSPAQVYRTGPGGLSRIFLSDGSVATLNADTEMRVRFTASRRDITLVRGEAHFSVAHDTHRPFEVHARDRVVVAVGTAFDVRVDSRHRVEVTVTEGRVALLEDGDAPPRADAPALQTITAGQGALLATRQIVVERIDSTEISRRLSWERRTLSFEGQTLSQAVAEFDRYTNRKLVIDDPSIAALQIGGSFRALDVASFVGALEHAFGISARVTAQGTIHLYRVGNDTRARLHP